MDARIFAELRNNGGDAFLHDLLRIRLPRINHVVNNRSATKIWTRHLRLRLGVRISRRHPSRMTIRIRSKRFVIEIEAELTQLPKLIGDIFSGVSHRSV